MDTQRDDSSDLVSVGPRPNLWLTGLGLIAVVGLVAGPWLHLAASGPGAAIVRFAGSSVTTLGVVGLVALVAVRALMWRPDDAQR